MTRRLEKRVESLEETADAGDDPLVFVINHQNANGETVERETYRENSEGGFDVEHEDVDGFDYASGSTWSSKREADE